MHPASEMHEKFALKLFNKLKESYKFFAPREPLMKIFNENYGIKIEKLNDTFCDCSFLFNSKDKHQKKDIKNLTEIFQLALIDNDRIIKEVLLDLRWIDTEGEIISENPDIIEAFETVKPKIEVTKAGSSSTVRVINVA